MHEGKKKGGKEEGGGRDHEFWQTEDVHVFWKVESTEQKCAERRVFRKRKDRKILGRQG